MDTIATFPALDHLAGRPSPAPAQQPGLRAPAPRGRERRRTGASLAALVALALAVWTLATWSEQQRLARQRGERLAREPVSGTIRP